MGFWNKVALVTIGIVWTAYGMSVGRDLYRLGYANGGNDVVEHMQEVERFNDKVADLKKTLEDE